MLAEGYRPALDGVRAVAVGGVIAYHLGAPLPGGFLGVDIFFVLSGYLITSLLLDEWTRTARIDLPAFWARRARRLLPALLVVVLVAAVFAARGPIIGLEARRGDMLATLAYYANWHFIVTDQSYFAGYAGASPLRHMWSLAIEEQFYVLWPLILLVVCRWRRSRWLPLTLLAGAAASAGAMELLYDPAHPSRAYLGSDGRAHQLLIGAMLAVVMRRASGALHRPEVARLLQLGGPVCALAVALALAVTPDESPSYFHGGSLLFAVAVAAWLLVLELRPGGLGARLLSLSPLVATGRISYGLYLWHWPMIIWIRESQHGGSWSGPTRSAVTLAATFAVATASYWLVERPIRAGRLIWVGRSVRRLAVAASAALAVVAVVTVQATASDVSGIAQQVSDTSVSSCPPEQDRGWCVRVERLTADAPMVAVIGDSTSLALDPGMRQEAARRGFGYIQGGRNGCAFLALPLLSTGGPGAPAQAARCASSATALLDDIDRGAHPDVWLISDRVMLGNLLVGDRELAWGGEHDQRLEAALVGSLRRLSATGARVVVMSTPPAGQPVDCVLHRQPATCTASLADPKTRELRSLLRRAVASAGRSVTLVSVDDVLCPAPSRRCPAVLHGELVRYDGVHFTGRFSRLIVPELLDRAADLGVEAVRG